MLKWLLLAGGLVLLYLWIKNKNRPRSAAVSAGAVNPAVAVPEAMLQCRLCGLHLPKTEGVVCEDRFYCSAEHRDRLDAQGWIGGALWRASPHHDARPKGYTPDLVVLHHISLPPGEFMRSPSTQYIIDFFQNQLDPSAHPYFAQIADQRVSSHFLISRQGRLIQFVSTKERAWHAGASQFEGRERCNDFSIGIELEGDGETPFEDGQYQTLKHLVWQLRAQHPELRFAGHSDIAPDRKTDPGVYFDWVRFQKDNTLTADALPFGLSLR